MDDLGKSIPVAEGMVDAEQNANKKHHNEFCLNCGTKLTDIYCQHCGQKDIPKRQTLGELWINFISSFWSFEGKFFKTSKYLIIKPGFLATEYNEGRRESYYHPARMYVFMSFIFFLLYFSLPEDETIELTDEDKKEMAEEAKELKNPNLDSILTTAYGKDSSLKRAMKAPWMDSLRSAAKKKNKKKPGFSISKSDYKSLKAYDSIQQTKPEKDRDNWFMRRLVTRSIELNDKYGDDPTKFSKEFQKAFSENFSKILFYLLPFFALILKILYVRRDYFYSEHLVFSIYYYNFFYFAGTIRMAVNLVPQLSWLGTIIGIWIFFYLLFAMKRMYKQGWGKTILKFVLFEFIFFFLATLAIVVNAMLIIMML